MVDPGQKGNGFGESLGQFALKEAKPLGYQTRHFNLVISSNPFTVSLWRSLIFQVIGGIPEAYRHIVKDLESAFVGYRNL